MRRALLALVLVGCTSWEAAPRARTVAVDVLDCEEIEMASRAENVWHATGCGGEIDVACTTGDNEPECQRVRIAGSRAFVPGEAGEDIETEPLLAEPTPPPASVDPAADAALRAAIDARRDDVLACAARDRVVVRVRTDANGAASVTLGGELGGSPEEGCVRAALAGITGAGSIEVIHLVRAAN